MTQAPVARPEELVQTFVERARAAAAEVTIAASIGEAAQGIVDVGGRALDSDRYVATPTVLAAYPWLGAALAAHGVPIEVAGATQGSRQTASEIAGRLAGTVGITLAVAGVAETGSVLSADVELPARLVGMLAGAVHVLLPARAILRGLEDMGMLLSRLSAEGARRLSIVTGPSRTADIERVLTIGVQGPRILHIIVTTWTEDGPSAGRVT